MDGWRWKIGSMIAQFGWWFVGIGAAIAWKNPGNYPWNRVE